MILSLNGKKNFVRGLYKERNRIIARLSLVGDNVPNRSVRCPWPVGDDVPNRSVCCPWPVGDDGKTK